MTESSNPALPGEAERVAELHAFGILDTLPEQAFDDLAALAAHACSTPMAQVNLIDAKRQWTKAAVGTVVTSMLREHAICSHALTATRLLVIPDTRADPRTAGLPDVVNPPHYRFYAGAPLRTTSGRAIGTVCVADIVPRELSDDQRAALEALGRQAMAHLELRRSAEALRAVVIRQAASETALRRSEEQFRLTAHIAEAVSDATGRAEALRAAIHRVCLYTGWSYGEVWIPDDDARMRRGPVWHSGAAELAEFAERSTAFSYGLGEGITGTAWLTRKPVWMDTTSAATSPAVHARAPLAAAAGLRAALALPILSEGDVIAVVGFFMRNRTPDDDRLVPLLTIVAAQLGPVIQRKRTEDALRLSEERYRLLFASNPAPMWVYDTGTLRFLEVNDAAVHSYGYTREEFLAMSIADIRSAEDVADLKRDLQSPEGLNVSGLRRHRRKDGTLIDVDITTHSLLFTGRRARLVLATDVTEQKRAQTALLESEERFRRLSAVASEGIIISVDGEIIEANEAACRMFGAERERLVGSSIFDLVVPHARDQVVELINGPTDRPYETVGNRADGSLFDIMITPKSMQYMGRTARVAAIRDISERREVDRLKTEFVSIVSHELRTPLTSIRGSLGLMEGGIAGPLPPKAVDLIRIARQNSDRLIRLINDILDIEKIEAGKMELKLSLFDAADVVATAVNDTRGIAEGSRVRVIADLARLGRISGDRDRVVQVLVNLLSNAIKFSPDGGTVTVALRAGRAGFLRFTVEDRGPGLSPSQIEKLFVKFQQLDARDSRTKMGTGLGLAISRAIIEEHGGRIAVDSTPGRGSTFWFELPAGPVDSARTTDRTILSVEDDDELSRLLNRTLSAEGFRVVHARTLAEADLLAREFVPDAVLLDIHLPDGNGLDLLRRMRGDQRLAEVPTVVLSGRPHDVTYTDTRVTAWLTKPFELPDLLRAVRHAVRRPGPPRVLLVEDDDGARTVMVARLGTLGIECVEAEDGAQALTLARAAAPDLIILDVTIPRLDGYAFVETLRKEAARSVPLLVYTGHDLNEQQRDALTLGVTRHLTKGRASEENVEAAIRELLGGVLEVARNPHPPASIAR
ncbi:MAG: hypothetical protein NVS1B4_09350 [Gemmatimonadaceae bacterium]